MAIFLWKRETPKEIVNLHNSDPFSYKSVSKTTAARYIQVIDTECVYIQLANLRVPNPKREKIKRCFFPENEDS